LKKFVRYKTKEWKHVKSALNLVKLLIFLVFSYEYMLPILYLAYSAYSPTIIEKASGQIGSGPR